MTSRAILVALSRLAFSSLLVLSAASSCFALTPKSPEVKNAVAKGVEFMKTTDTGRVGGQALMGIALLKCHVPRDHPKIVAIRDAVRREVAKSKFSFNQLYTTAVFTIFLIELDPETHGPEIRKLVNYLESEARPYGGWGYLGAPHPDTGDTSMTQYVMLALWEADQSGFDVSPRVVEAAALWLSKTQDPSGGFGYQGTIAQGGGLVRQSGVSVSLTTAGTGAFYMAQDLLGVLRDKAKEDDGLPEALTKVSDANSRAKKTNLSRQFFSATEARGNAWLAQNMTFNIPSYRQYFFYAYERYWALRELAGDKAPNDWYTEVARYLIDSQAEDGSWNCSHGPGIETAFSVLCLIRSMKESIEKDRTFGTGHLVGGRGLPKDSDLVQIRDGKVMSKAEASALENVLKDIGDADGEKYTEAIGALSELPPDEAKALISKQAGRLRELAGGTSADERLAAVKALAHAGTLDDVPTLIYVLTDPEPEIVLAARDGLRRISRKIHGFEMPDDFDETDRRTAIDKWKAWYLAIRPDAEFEN